MNYWNLIRVIGKFATMIAFLAGTNSQAASEVFVIDQEHTKVGFSVSHLVISTVEGRFKNFEGEVTFDPKDPKAKSAKVTVEIEAKSIDTGVLERDDHLRSKDFFNVESEKGKKITFKSTSFESKNGKDIRIVGQLTIAGTTKEVILTGKYLGEASAYDVKRIAFKATTKIKRQDFGIKWNDVVEVGPIVGDDVEIELVVQAKRKADLG